MMTNTDVETFSERLKEEVRRQRLTMAEVGAMVDVTAGTVCAWLNGWCMPKPAKIAALAQSLGVPIEALCPDWLPKPERGDPIDAMERRLIRKYIEQGNGYGFVHDIMWKVRVATGKVKDEDAE
jgi:transcriptional regulator with XRE-family HTH domain